MTVKPREEDFNYMLGRIIGGIARLKERIENIEKHLDINPPESVLSGHDK